MTRTITILGLTQVVAVVLGFFALAIVLRRYGYPGEPAKVGSNFFTYHWSTLTLFLRHYGFIFLLVPLAWTVLAANADYRSRNLGIYFWMILGALFPLMILAPFFYAIFRPYVAVAN